MKREKTMVHMKTAKCRTCGGIIFKLAGKAAKFCHDECESCRDNAAEAAWLAQQERLAETGGSDDSAYRRDMIAAGRGHLLR